MHNMQSMQTSLQTFRSGNETEPRQGKAKRTAVEHIRICSQVYTRSSILASKGIIRDPKGTRAVYKDIRKGCKRLVMTCHKHSKIFQANLLGPEL